MPLVAERDKMKKYCLTNCAKQKLSKTKEAFIEVAATILPVVVIVLAYLVFSSILGFIGQGLWAVFMGPVSPLPAVSFIEFGSIIFLFSIAVATGCLLIYKVLEGLYVMIKTLVTNILLKKNGWGEETTCHIFEECVEEPEEKSEES